MGAPNDIYLLQVRGTKGAQDIVHTLHFLGDLTNDDPTLQQALINAWQASSQAAWLGIAYGDYTLSDITCQRVCGSTPLPSPTVETVNLTGTRGALTAANSAAPWLAMLSREATGFAGKSYRGRFFTPLPADTDCDFQTLTGTVTTLLQAYLTSLGSYLVGGANADWHLFVYSRKLASVPGVQCQNTGALVTSLSYSPYLTSMRSRRSRTGA